MEKRLFSPTRRPVELISATPIIPELLVIKFNWALTVAARMFDACKVLLLKDPSPVENWWHAYSTSAYSESRTARRFPFLINIDDLHVYVSVTKTLKSDQYRTSESFAVALVVHAHRWQ